MSNPIKVEVWSDVQCPWCYIGKRKFEAGAAEFGGEVDVEYRSFELSPDTPADFVGTPADYLSARKGLPPEQVKAMLANVTAIAAQVGLNYDFGAMKQTNTLKAHELLHFAKSQGLQLEMKERLLRAYFEEGAHVGDLTQLADLAAEVGLNGDEVLRVLETGEFADAVSADQAQARAYGIQGVPFFVIDGRYGISGAQEAATFAQALRQVSEERVSS
ncbi:DsbA family oxidoreductase [Salinibacterium sp. SYSU T00001]|uniref:DsbA family oxidoreductase n=1 Tax=Homoserinimonas sedimenticola TaxID=2986805 RepID=UPI00223585F6|nr:DsbA family oxidoreductase [Salinibacterium sedimenticola]MCW4384571.1 DsbA family oxidoreductase [Salinibacterium sedimenticola]